MAEAAELLQPDRLRAESGGAGSATLPQSLYFAFLSYSHVDSGWGEWLHDELEKFHVPSSLAGRLTTAGIIPRRLTPIFRDRKELAASSDLGMEIREALIASRYLIVLCSPSAAQSRWTNAEIDTFKRVRPDGCVLAVIVDGEPFASDIPGRETDECLPPALRIRYDRRGRPTTKRAEPLCTDLRENRDGKRLGLLKLVAGMLGVGLDNLVQRDTVRRQRRLALLAAASLAGMAITSGLAVAAIQARDAARDQRREAEGLINYMLGDLKQKLEPIGRLDALDGVGGRVLQYYQKQDKNDLSDSALLQRSRALALMGGVANSRGNLQEASRLYNEALAGTAEAIRRNPDDPERYYDHAQSIFYTGDIAMRLGDSKRSEAAFREYKRLAGKMVALDPDNMKWRMEAQNADANLGIMLFDQRRYSEAARQFEAALRTIEAITTADPENNEYQKSLVEALAWVADGHLAEGRLDLAMAERRRNVTVLEGLLKQRRGDVEYGEKLVPAHRSLGRLYAFRGQFDRAIAEIRAATDQSDALLAVERGNSKWVEIAAKAHLDLANTQLNARHLPEAEAELGTGCRLALSLASRNAVVFGRVLRRDCLMIQTKLALASGSGEQALPLAEKALEAARSVKSTDPIEDGFATAKAYRLIGDAQRLQGKAGAARLSWDQALAAFPQTATERPMEMSERRMILVRLGRTAEAQRIANRLASMGYREPEFGSS